MIGKRFRSLPFIFANDNYTLSLVLLLVTDGVTYLWGTDGPKTVYNEFEHKEAGVPIWSSNSTAAGVKDKEFFNITQKAYVETFKNPKTWMEANGPAIENMIQEYEDNWQSYSKYVSIEENTGYISNDAAVYKAGQAWQDAAEAGYNLYSYVSTKYYIEGAEVWKESNYPWAVNFFSNLDQIAGVSESYTEGVNVSGMFDDVKNTILYDIMSGTVTDVIGSDFDLTGIGSFELAVGGKKLDTTVSGNTVYFGEKTGTDYPYSVTYYPNGVNGDTREQFVWEINVPVESTKQLELTYTLKLVNKSTVEGSHTALTNEEAVIEYTPTTGDPGSKDFPKPEVTYTVSGGGTITPPDSGSGGSGSSGNSGSSGSSSSPTRTPSAQTGDETNILLPVVTLIIAAAVIGTVGTVYYKKKRS